MPWPSGVDHQGIGHAHGVEAVVELEALGRRAFHVALADIDEGRGLRGLDVADR
jgi:hypothetical protein